MYSPMPALMTSSRSSCLAIFDNLLVRRNASCSVCTTCADALSDFEEFTIRVDSRIGRKDRCSKWASTGSTKQISGNTGPMPTAERHEPMMNAIRLATFKIFAQRWKRSQNASHTELADTLPVVEGPA